MSIDDVFNVLKDRGNFGHEGRPGHQGGSAPRGLNVSQFKLDKKTKTLSAKLSELPEFKGGNSLAVQSDSKTIYFNFAGKRNNNWEYVSEFESKIKKLVVINDK